MTYKTETENLFYSLFHTKGFTGWLNVSCSICGKVHPGSCDITKDPDFIRAYEAYKNRGGQK